ncbi:MAG: alpha hydrolase [Halobacteriota archaeon]|nr:alpha hydrolase [Halobacteriota archaeon]
MRVRVLFSGGRDSSLAALMLANFFEVELVSCTFGILKNWEIAEGVAELIGFPFKVLNLDRTIIEDAVEQMISDGHARGGITQIHKSALKGVAELPDSEMIADGCRRDDKTPVLTRGEIRSLEDRFGVQYIQPLAGFGRRTLDLLVNRYFEVEELEGRLIDGPEYEYEIRKVVRERYSEYKNNELFPRFHTHSRVVKVKEFHP